MEESTAPRPSQEARNWALVAHLGPVVLSLLSVGILGWLVPLVVWLTQKEANPFAAVHAKESLNFRITLLIFYLVALPIFFVFFCLGIPIWIALWVTEIILSIMAAVRASDGQPFRYPLTLRLVS